MNKLTSLGNIYGSLAITTGQSWWVAPAAAYTINGKAYTASDDNVGTTAERALLTIARAIALATASTGDVIYLLPGAHSVTASLAVSKAGLRIFGFPGNAIRPASSITISASDEIMNVTAADVELAWLRLIPITAKAAVDFSVAAHRLYVHHCSFDMATPVASTSTLGVAAAAATSAPTYLRVSRNYFESDGAQGAGVAVGDAQNFVVEGNTFALAAGTWAAAATQDGVLGFGVFRDNDFLCFQAGTMTIGIRGTDVTSVSSTGILRNFFGDDVSTPIDDYGAGDAFIAQNYKASVGVASGGLLWSSTT